MLIGSGSSRSAKIVNEAFKPTASIVVFKIATSEEVDRFADKPTVRIVRPDVMGIAPPRDDSDLPLVGIFEILATDSSAAARTITLSGLPLNVELWPGDMIINATAAGPSSVRYCVGSKTFAACPANTCPDNQKCLVRIEDGRPDIVASNITDLQFSYLMGGSPETSAPHLRLLSPRTAKGTSGR